MHSRIQMIWCRTLKSWTAFLSIIFPLLQTEEKVTGKERERKKNCKCKFRWPTKIFCTIITCIPQSNTTYNKYRFVIHTHTNRFVESFFYCLVCCTYADWKWKLLFQKRSECRKKKNWKEQSAYSIRIHKNESVAERFKRETIMLILVYMNVASLTFLILWLCWDMIFRVISFFFVFFLCFLFYYCKIMVKQNEKKKCDTRKWSNTPKNKYHVLYALCSMVYLTNAKALFDREERERIKFEKIKLNL